MWRASLKKTTATTATTKINVNKEADAQIASNGVFKITAKKLAEHLQHLLSSLRPAPRKGNCNLIIYSHRCLVTKYILIRPEAALLFVQNEP